VSFFTVASPEGGASFEIAARVFPHRRRVVTDLSHDVDDDDDERRAAA
jgi:hypothetical protein